MPRYRPRLRQQQQLLEGEVAFTDHQQHTKHIIVKMGGKGSDEGGFPDEIFQQMQAGHEKFMRELEEEGRRFQQAPDRGNHVDDNAKTSPATTSLPPGHSDRNFFVSFKDFVDNNLSSLTESFRSLPTNIAELRTKMQEEREARKEEELAVSRRWNGLEESPDHVQMMAERASAEQREEAVSSTLMLLREAKNRNAHVPEDKIRALYKDATLPGSLDLFAAPMLSPGGACYYQPDAGYNAPSTAIWRIGSPSYRWLSVDWFKRSPYSPISLEEHPHLGEYGSDWRAAFEDLLNATLDKPMASREQWGYRPNGCPQSTLYGPGLDWMLSLQCRGVLPPQLPSLYNARWPSKTSQATSLDLDAVEKQLLHASAWRRQQRFQAGTVVGDVRELVDEIATPAPEQQASKSYGAYQPETEQDLYDGYSNMQLEEDLKQWELAAQQNYQRGLEDSQNQDEMQRPAAGNRGTPAREVPPQQSALLDYQQELLYLLHNTERRLREAQRSAAEEPLMSEEAHINEYDRLMIRNDLAHAHGHLDDLLGLFQNHMGEGTTPSGAFRQIEEFVRTFSWGDGRTLQERAELLERMKQEREALGLDDDVASPAHEQNTPLSTPEYPATTPKSPALPSKSAHVAEAKVDVLSSLTTSHTTRLPDGTVTTKVVLKQRFADGREETEEKTHTYQESMSTQQRRLDEGPQEAREEPKRKGWFWT